jgi:hypothetical protein
MTDVLASELKTYEQHRDELLETAEGKFVLVHETEVAGMYETQMDGINEGYRRFGNVPFLVKQILKVEVPLNFSSHYLGI